ncbi:MAG TPA: cupin-like domain-containing protein [Saprospiraceae bacterium]|nr:cupin-like domain-containing protein [Saprospiraceae bacterium]HMP15308.1 cupin-like domain-containing protein [Saprospiraceae bacterium]
MLTLKPVDKRTRLTREEFAEAYLKPCKPVVFTDLTEAWPAKAKWTIEFFKDKYGHLEVPVVSNNYSKPGKGYMTPDMVIPLRAYLEKLEAGPTDLRLFLFNIFRYAPELTHDFFIPGITDGFIREFPFMFFGGEGSKVALHYDIDLSHVFLNQFHGRKRVVLFSPEQSKYLYQHPFTVASYVDVNNPDYEKYPALRKVEGYEVMLLPGETVFMPSGYWHYIEYTDGGYSMSLRANESYVRRARGLWNIARHYVVDKGMNKIMGDDWRKMKEGMAKRRAGDLVS